MSCSATRTALWIAAWALATWCYRAFRVFPYLSIRSAEKRCGKSRLLGLLARVCFNASPVTAHPTEAQLYRSAARTGGVQLFDEVETLRGDKDRFDALIAVLNVGFERGGVVTRLEKRGERFVEEPYEVYAPRVLAGLAGLKDTLEDRALPLFMLRKRRNESVLRLNRATDTDAQALRDQCALACLTHIQHILAAYDGVPTVLEHEGIDDRAVDLWSPLVAMALVADAEDDRGRVGELLEVARQVGTVREAEAEAGPTARLLEALEAICQDRGEAVAPADLLAALRARPGWDWLKTTRRLAGLLNPLGLYRQQVWDGKRRRWAYVLEAGQLSDLLARYGASAEPPEGLAERAAADASPGARKRCKPVKAVKTRIWSGVSPDRASTGRARCRSGEKPHEQRRFTASPDRTGSKPSGVHWSEPECSEPLRWHTETGDGLGSDLAARVQKLLAGLVPAQRCRAGASPRGLVPLGSWTRPRQGSPR